MVPSRGGTADDVPPRSSRGLPRVSDLDDLDDADDVRAHFWLYAVFFLLTMAQALPLTAVQVLLNRDLGLERRPELVNRFFAVEFSMSTLKPLYAALSDLCPIRGLRRVPYMILGAVAHAAARQGFARVVDVGGLYVAGVLSVVFFSICETGADGALVQISAGDPKRSMRAQARGMMVRSAGSLVATALSVPLLAAATARTCVALAGCFSLAAAAAASRVREDANRRDRNAASERETSVDANGRTANGRTANGRTANGRTANGRTANGRTANGRTANAAAASLRALAPCLTPRVGRAAAFVFAYRIPPTALVTFTSFTYERFDLPNWSYAALLLVSTVGGVAAAWAYGRASRTLTLAASFVAGAAVDAVCGLARLAVIDADDGVSAPAVALAASSLVTSFGIMFGYMPILALAARVAPPGLEAFGYALLLFVADAATSTGSMLAAELTRALGIGEGEGRSWSNLAAFVWMCAVMKLAPLALVSLAEENRGTDGDRYRRHEDEDEDEDDDGERALGERKANAGGGDAEDGDVEEESDAARLLTSRACGGSSGSRGSESGRGAVRSRVRDTLVSHVVY